MRMAVEVRKGTCRGRGLGKIRAALRLGSQDGDILARLGNNSGVS